MAEAAAEQLRPAKVGPRIGIVVPVYKHAVLVDEAIRSAIEQQADVSSIVVAVNDGCPMPETELTLRSWAEAYPDRVVVIRRPNGGLSAARNTGIRYLLGNHPSVEGIFLLDADNLLEPRALRVFAQLLDRYPNADWFYPQFDMFGLEANWSNGGPYSLLMQRAENTCEAGSLIRRRVLEAGIRFDETMRLGYEDWDFWLSAARSGFRGHPVDAPVFRYRKRPESMLSGSHRDDAEIRGYLRRKHAWLYTARTGLALEHEEAHRYRIIFVDSDRILVLTDPLQPDKELTADAFAEEVWNWIALPGESHAGDVWVITTEAAWEMLRKAGLLRFALWDLERRLGGTEISTLSLKRSANGGYAIAEPEDKERAHQEAVMVALSADLTRKVLLDPEDDWIGRVADRKPSAEFSSRVLLLDTDFFISSLSGGTVSVLPALFAKLRRSRWSSARNVTWSWRSQWLPSRDQLQVRSRSTAGVLRPAVPGSDGVLSVCFLLSIAEFGGVEAVAVNVAVEMRRRGISTALCMIGTNPIRLAGDVGEAFDEIMWFPEQALLSWGGPVYQGTRLPPALESSTERDLLGLLSGFDGVIGFHPSGAFSVFDRLRQSGIVTLFYEHVVDVGAFGRESGSPVVALAYESGCDLVATCSHQLRNWFHARGFPEGKLLAVPNAPGYPMTAKEQAKVLKARAAASPDRPLRALFLGRFDRQKGLGRLIKIILRLRHAAAPVEWRVVGKAVVDNDEDIAKLSELVKPLPPVYMADERTALYTWADVVVLPSRFEGLPLTVLEAQRCGAVPLVARTGAVEEAVAHGVDGLVVSQVDCVEEMVAALQKLAADRNMLARLSKAAAVKICSWEKSVAPLIERIEAEVMQRRNKT